MIKKNKKGFVITEMLMVAVFVVTIFTFIYTSTIPLIGKYRDIAERENNIEIVYKLYNIRKLIRKDDNFVELADEDVKRISCSDLANIDSCNNLIDYLDLNNYDLFYINNIGSNLSNPLFSDEIKDYLNKYSDDSQKILLLQDKDEHTIAHLVYEHENVMNTLPTSITRFKNQISKVVFQKENKEIMENRYNNASIKANITYDNKGRVLAWLEADSLNSGMYVLYIESNGITYLNTGNQLFKDYTNVQEIDFNNVDTSKVTNMSEMFSGCESLLNLNITLFNTSKVTTMYGMFRNCSSLPILNINNFDTSEVQNMAYMFNNCSMLYLLELNNFDTKKVKTMESMFSECSSLVDIYVSDLWNTSAVTNSNNMFNNIINIYGGNGTGYNSSFIDKTYARIDGLNAKDGYLKYKSSDDLYMQVLNLVKNGSFEDGYSSWTTKAANGTNPITLNTTYKKIGNKSSSRITSSENTNYLSQNISFIENHKYYYFMHGYTTSSSNQAIISEIDSRSGSKITINAKSNLGWIKESIIYSGISTESREILINYGLTTGVTFVDGIGIIDLTEIFGRGSEPTKAWCDANIDYYNDIIRYHV